MGLIVISKRRGIVRRFFRRLGRALCIWLWFQDEAFALRNELEALRIEKDAIKLELNEISKALSRVIR